MISSRILQLLLLVSSIAPQMIGMVPAEEVRTVSYPIQEIGEEIAQRIEELPKELKYKIFSSALALRESPKYEVYKKFDVGSKVLGIAFNADNTRALTGSKDEACLWDIKTGRILKELKGHTDYISSVALNADGTIVLTGCFDETVRVWNALTGALLKTFQVGSWVTSVALSADGRTALTGSINGIARLYNTSTGEILNVLEGHASGIGSVALSADGALALTGSADGTARVWNVLTGESIILKVGSSVNSVALSANGAIALAAASNRKVLVWDVKWGILLNTLLTGSYISSVVVSKDGKRALVGTHGNTIQVWNTKPLPGQKETSIPLTVLEGHKGEVKAVAFGDADFIASGSQDRTALIWKPFALEPQGPQENIEVLRQAYKETFARPKFLYPDKK